MNVSYKFTMYENNVEILFNILSGQELSSIVDTLSTILNVDDEYNKNIVFYGEEEEYIYVKNVEEKRIQRLLDVRTPVILRQYGVSPWGKVEFSFTLMEEESREEDTTNSL